MTEVFKSATSQSFFFELVDSTTGLPKTGIVYTDVTASYARTRSARVAITPATLASASASYSSGGFILVDDTNQPGVYRFDVPDAAFATGAEEVVVTLKATGCRTQSRAFRLSEWNDQVAYVPITASSFASSSITASSIAANAIGSAEIADGALTAAKFATGILPTTVADSEIALQYNVYVAGFDSAATSPDTANIAAIKAKTDNLPADPAASSDVIVSGGGGGITVIDSDDAILTTTSPTTDADDGTVTIYAGASYTGTGEGIAKSRTWTGDSLDGATATLYVIRQDQYEDVTDATAWTALDTATVTQTGTTIAVSFNPAYTATAALDWGTDGAGRTIYRAHVVIAASKKPLWDFALIVKRGEWA